jgi:tetratricopeptide (TPR) repeat protein
MENERQRNWLVGLALFLGTLVLYWPATLFDYINFDDPWYVFDNPHVLNGLSWHGFVWTLTATEPSNWHPLTLLSHMADCSLFGVFPGGHHLTSILWHAANAVLLWRLLERLTRAFWPSALAAALFAWHPLNVESVVWIAERKNVLSAFFFILTIWAYAAYAENRKSKRFYFLSLLAFALGLASKSMLVTLPCVLLLLDYWPLKRMQNSECRMQNLRGLLLEKIPFFALTVADSVVTFLVQKNDGAVSTLTLVPWENRLLNVPAAYATYLVQTFWPTDLCVFHPFPEEIHLAASLISLAILAAVTVTVWLGGKKFPWLPVGWFWFLGMLVPVIGLVQVGGQGWADRYAYLPLIGVFLMLACALGEFVRARPQFRNLAGISAAAFVGICLVQTGRQIMTWQNSVAAFTRVAALNPESATAQDMLGRAYDADGQSEKSIERYALAVRLRPEAVEMRSDLGRALMRAGRFAEAENALGDALARIPGSVPLHDLRGVVFMLDGKPVAAQAEFSRAVALDPRAADSYFKLGKAQLATGQNREAITNFTVALRLRPDAPEALRSLAQAYAGAGETSEAVAVAGRALKIAQAAGDAELAERIAAEIKTYQTAPAAE